MTLTEACENYKALTEVQSVKPTKKRTTEIRKALLVIKKQCDLERKALLPPKTPKTNLDIVQQAISTSREEEKQLDVVISSNEPVKEVKIKKRKTVKVSK